MSEKSDYFLTEFLKPLKTTDDNISVRLSILFVLKHIAPHKFKQLNLTENLNSVISEIAKTTKRPAPLLDNIISKIKNVFHKSKSLYDLQAKLDYWYYTKLLGYGDKFKVDAELIKKIMTDDKIKTVVLPKDAILLYIYIRTLSFCDSQKYGLFKKHIPHLKKVAQRDYNLYAYFLTHVILYDTYFGQKKAPKSSLDALGELHDFCDNQLKFERENVDLMAEIILCCRLCQAFDFPYYSKLVKTIMAVEKFFHYHECAVLAAATFDEKSTSNLQNSSNDNYNSLRS